jgi:hypothetical protein
MRVLFALCLSLFLAIHISPSLAAGPMPGPNPTYQIKEESQADRDLAAFKAKLDTIRAHAGISCDQEAHPDRNDALKNRLRNAAWRDQAHRELDALVPNEEGVQKPNFRANHRAFLQGHLTAIRQLDACP